MLVFRTTENGTDSPTTIIGKFIGSLYIKICRGGVAYVNGEATLFIGRGIYIKVILQVGEHQLIYWDISATVLLIGHLVDAHT